MKKYKHYSFDLWMTLIKSNPSFKEERAKFFYNNFNSKKKPLQEIKTIFRNVDLLCGAITEKTGSHIASSDMYLMVINQINENTTCFEDIDLKALELDMEEMVMTYSPQIYSADTLECLEKLKEITKATFSLLSNTAFIKGSTLKNILSKNKLSEFFEFQLYSDEAGVSKPNVKFYDVMIQKVTSFPGNEAIGLKNIIHVGDNPTADFKGAAYAGISNFLINSNDKSIFDLL